MNAINTSDHVRFETGVGIGGYMELFLFVVQFAEDGGRGVQGVEVAEGVLYECPSRRRLSGWVG
jgi:hypothetical protein